MNILLRPFKNNTIYYDYYTQHNSWTPRFASGMQTALVNLYTSEAILCKRSIIITIIISIQFHNLKI